ncbi:hypothetical protein GCM10027275_25480 [Rhabdobacter roseus]|uniref:4-amino-4-deoxy-L-arabinose transferase-like glycosyltransferase n=1 Tax=Rhabdobacter roseus TaxID=1655419 RepID=A0A840TSE6_9BACT|nr:glycosyltransferase family 39 protein [Rhabdobacter roseus]MBB5284492.1 4-amino-4-deoxy-L-arabinose transferase-like glycosyltransferase [Rhabdobacter roseus]
MVTFFKREDALLYLLLLGIALRVLVYLILPPLGDSAQTDVIQFILEKGRLPLTSELPAAGQPPLYYLLASLFARFDEPGSQKAQQLLSLLLSVGSLYFLYQLSKQLLSEVLLRNGSFLLAAVLPSFLLGSLTVSNTALTYFLGILLLWVLSKYIHQPSQTHEIALAVVLGLGILTQGTFLVLGLPLVVVVALVLWKVDAAAKLIFFRLLLFALIALTIGTYKYLENYYIEGRFFIPDPAMASEPLGTFLAQAGTLYSAFWQPEAEGTSSSLSSRYLRPVIFLLALLPTLLILLGFVVKSVSVLRFLSKLKKSNRTYFAKRLEEGTWLLLLVLTGVWFFRNASPATAMLGLSFFPLMYLLYLGFRFLHESAAALLQVGYLLWLGLAGLYVLHYGLLGFGG